MVERGVREPYEDEEALDRVFHALSDQTRRALLWRLASEPGASVTELAAPFDMSLNAVSKHLKVLETAHLLRRERDGRLHRCSADLGALVAATKALLSYEAFWNNRLDDLETFLREDDA